MPKEIPTCPPKPQSAESGKRSYDIELITPMFGGGVVNRENDVTLPIRPTAIRGQLQFWWRATVGAQYETRQELRAAQSAIWGDTSKASSVHVRVEAVKFDNPEPCAQFERDHKDQRRYRSMASWNSPFNNTALPYALFSFQGQFAKGGRQIETKPAACIHKVAFRLTVICHQRIDFGNQVEPALWAWVNFGGLGSRTRRGCGAIYCQKLAPTNLESLDMWYREHVPAIGCRIRDWPTMPTQFLYFPHSGTPINQWNQVIGLFRDFRQKPGNTPGHARPPGPARSWYPEPDTIRQISECHSIGHDPSLHLSGGRPLPNGFPRAEFGLPIVFKFIDDKRGDPQRTTLHPYVGGQENNKGTADAPDIHVTGGEIKDRMASPVILKPLALSKDNSVAIIVPMQTHRLEHVTLIGDRGVDCTPRHTVPIQDTKFVEYPHSPIRGLTTTGSALEAFLNLATQAYGTNAAHVETGYRRVSV